MFTADILRQWNELLLLLFLFLPVVAVVVCLFVFPVFQDSVLPVFWGCSGVFGVRYSSSFCTCPLQGIITFSLSVCLLFFSAIVFADGHLRLINDLINRIAFETVIFLFSSLIMLRFFSVLEETK